MERKELEREVVKRLNISTPLMEDIVKQAITMKKTAELEDILKRMIESGK